MDESVLLEVGRDAVIVTLKLGAPLMIIALLIGLIISLFQALTQIQEVTLTFVPKIIVVFIAMLLLAPFMLHTLSDFTERIMQQAVG
ncbi:MAG TPA: flagellar biosynthesis protein FliQ [Dongiaceae bacterium]|jgi:flagellar biosynthesis protein FliQ|nr:flagellar biosynthesis protein FliQ [Dongiaceae bacterium]HSE74365.1 flagellar biosynthesis protein FliQ [Dongiaceae bacterium]